MAQTPFGLPVDPLEKNIIAVSNKSFTGLASKWSSFPVGIINSENSMCFVDGPKTIIWVFSPVKRIADSIKSTLSGPQNINLGWTRFIRYELSEVDNVGSRQDTLTCRNMAAKYGIQVSRIFGAHRVIRSLEVTPIACMCCAVLIHLIRRSSYVCLCPVIASICKNKSQ